jgi:hypothetical protein
MRRTQEQNLQNLDTIIDVIDPVRAVRIATHRIEAQTLVAIDPGVFWSLAPEPRTGLVRLQVWHASVEGMAQDGTVRRSVH